jgi:transcriptional regulator with XRE-family HTH domain
MSIVASSASCVKSPAPQEDKFRTLVARTLEFARLAQALTIEEAAGLVRVRPALWQQWENATDVPTLDELASIAAGASDPTDWPFPRFQLSRDEAADLTAGVLAWRLPYSGALVQVVTEPAGRPWGSEWIERHETA